MPNPGSEHHVIADLAARLARAEGELDEAKAEIANERRRATDAEYMAHAYRNMLGETGLKVAEMWREKGVKRVHFSWAEGAANLTGEERAKHILEWEYAPSREVDPREIDGTSPTISVEEYVSMMEKRNG